MAKICPCDCGCENDEDWHNEIRCACKELNCPCINISIEQKADAWADKCKKHYIWECGNHPGCRCICHNGSPRLKYLY